MIIWHRNLWMDEIVRKNPGKYKRAVERGKFKLSLYCITLPSNPENLLDIYHVNEFLFPYYQGKEITVVGMAHSREAAFELVREMVEQVYRQGSDVNLREYFEGLCKT